MRDQEIYNDIGSLLWSVMPEDVEEIYFWADIYPDAEGNTITFLKKTGELSWFELGQSPKRIINDIMARAKELQKLPPYERQPWSHFKASLTEEGRFKMDFAYIPQADSWPGLFMKGVSDLSWEEAQEHYIPQKDWEKCVADREANYK